MAKPCTPHLIPQAAQLFELFACNGGVKGQSPLIPQAAQLFELFACNGGVKGQSPLRSLGGSKGGHSLT